MWAVSSLISIDCRSNDPLSASYSSSKNQVFYCHCAQLRRQTTFHHASQSCKQADEPVTLSPVFPVCSTSSLQKRKLLQISGVAKDRKLQKLQVPRQSEKRDKHQHDMSRMLNTPLEKKHNHQKCPLRSPSPRSPLFITTLLIDRDSSD